MISFPNAKINIGLYITGKRADGYHNLESLMIPVPLSDILEFRIGEGDQLFMHGIPVPGNPQENLVLKALNLMRAKKNIPPLEIHLYKSIPTGAGLGGGSANGAFMLRMLNDKFNMGLSTGVLEEMAMDMGSDCGFFIRNQPSLISGRGEIMHPFNPDLEELYLIILHPGFHVSTAEAYSHVKIRKESPALKEILREKPEKWRDLIFNDFEPSVFAKYKGIAELKELLYHQGAIYASMSGSGSSVFGLFRNKPDHKLFPERYQVYSGKAGFQG